MLNSPKNYSIICEIGSGTYGIVYKAKCEITNKIVALKKLDLSKQEFDGFPLTAIREIKLLKMLKHENIIRLLDIIMSKPGSQNQYRGSTFLVFEYMDHDFVGLKNIKVLYNVEFTLPQLKSIMMQILHGVKYLHEKKIMHRDLKSANILLNNQGEVKIADFGLARQLSNGPMMLYTNRVVTLWYRAPELLLGSNDYNCEIDIWSIGCIFYELLTGEILFAGDKESKQLELIYDKCGTPDNYNWPDVEKLRFYKELGPKTYIERRLKMMVKKRKGDIDEWALDLLDKLLILNPKFRITAEEALNHGFFRQNPLPAALGDMPRIEKECHEGLFKDKFKKQNIKQNQNPPMMNPQDFDKTKKSNFQFSMGNQNSTSNNSLRPTFSDRNLKFEPMQNLLTRFSKINRLPAQTEIKFPDEINSSQANVLETSNSSNNKKEINTQASSPLAIEFNGGLSGLQSLIGVTNEAGNKRKFEPEDKFSILDKILGDDNDKIDKRKKKTGEKIKKKIKTEINNK